ncbi:MAG TPA: ribosome maturation factor RimM [Geobacteraceae bacterium]|nr:ribosome maturation factor RimM [Geobacteraceae bacterium]
MFSSDSLVLIGKVVATHGIRGQLRVAPYSGDAGSILSHHTIVLKGPNGELDGYEVAGSSIHGKKVILSLESFHNINQVEHLVGREIFVRREQLPELPDGEYYWCDLIGLKVRTIGGGYLGELSDILAAGGNDVYVVRMGEKEYLIPAVEDIVAEINLAEGTMTVDPPEGLLDL